MRGFTIVELMIAMVLGLLVSGAVLSIFLTSRRSFDTDEMVQRMQDDARYAIQALSTDLSMAGYYADLMLPGSMTLDDSLNGFDGCAASGADNWIYRTVHPVTGGSLALTTVDNATGTAASTAFPCVTASEHVPGTDVIAVRRVAGAEAPAAGTADHVYLRTNGTLGLLYREPVAAPPAVDVPPPFTEWEYRASIYFVRNYSRAPGDGIPSLCRLVFGTGVAVPVPEVLAYGIENLQVEYGLDGDGDGEPNVYLSNPTLEQMQTAVSAQISILARSAERNAQYTNDKTYSIGNAPDYTPADNFYRRAFSITVGLHNLRNLRRLQPEQI